MKNYFKLHSLALLVLSAFGLFVSIKDENNAVAKADDEQTFLDIDYRLEKFNQTEKYESYHVSGSNSAHGVLPFLEWKNESETDNGYIIYKIDIPNGYALNSLTSSIDAFICDFISYDSRLANNVNMKIYVSKNSYSFKEPVITYLPVDNQIKTYTTVLDNYVKKYSTLFFKVELNHPAGTFLMNKTGIKLYSVKLTGTLMEFDSSKCIKSRAIYHDYDFTVDEDFTNLNPYNICLLEESVWKGIGLVPAAVESNGHITFKINPILEDQIEELELLISSSRFAYYNGNYGNYMSFLTSIDGVNFDLYQTIYGEKDVISDISINFTPCFEHLMINEFYIRIEFGTIIKGLGFNNKWIILQEIQIKGIEASHDFVKHDGLCTCSICDSFFYNQLSNPIEVFIKIYLHMDENVDGQCLIYYPLAKEAYLALSSNYKEEFFTNEQYKTAKLRFISWAKYHNDIVTIETIQSSTSSSNPVDLLNSAYQIMIITIIFSSFLLIFLLIIYIKKKKKLNIYK